MAGLSYICLPPSYIRQIPIDLLDYGADTELLSLSNVQIYI